MEYQWAWLLMVPPSEQKPWLVIVDTVAAGVIIAVGTLVACTVENAGLVAGRSILLAKMDRKKKYRSEQISELEMRLYNTMPSTIQFAHTKYQGWKGA